MFLNKLIIILKNLKNILFNKDEIFFKNNYNI